MKLSEIKSKPVPDVIAQLESLLADAKSGELQTFAFAAVQDKGFVSSGFAGNYDFTTIIGELRVLERNIMDSKLLLIRCPLPEFCE